MILNTIKGDILKTIYTHIAFAVNTEGYNDAGFAGMVATKFWPELMNTGPKKFGDVLSKEVSGRTFHALVCHSLEKNGWDKTPKYIAQCLEALDVNDDEEVAMVMVGGGLVGKMMGADPKKILEGVMNSKKKIVVYTL